MAQNGLIVTITFPTDRAFEPIVAQKLRVVVSTLLRSAIRMVNAARRGPAQGDRHVQRPDRQILFHQVAIGPADNAPWGKVNDHS